MILVDTNVISEVMRPSPSAAVIAWLNAQHSHDLYISSISLGEIEYGLRILPNGRKRNEPTDRFGAFIRQAFALRILSFDENAARAYGQIMSQRRSLGRPLSMADGQIAAIARTHGYAVATRNIRDFEDCGIDMVNPFAV